MMAALVYPIKSLTFLQKAPCICAKAPCICAKAHYICAKESHISAKEPYTSAKVSFCDGMAPLMAAMNVNCLADAQKSPAYPQKSHIDLQRFIV